LVMKKLHLQKSNFWGAVQFAANPVFILMFLSHTRHF